MSRHPARLALALATSLTVAACIEPGIPTGPGSAWAEFDPDAYRSPRPGASASALPTAALPAGQRLADGARAIGPGEEGGGLEAFSRLPEAGTPVDAEHAPASAAYRVAVAAEAAREGQVLLALPVDAATLPAGWEERGLVLEARGPHGWRTVPAMGRYDEATRLYWCRLTSPADQDAGAASAGARYGLAQAGGGWVYEIRLAYLLSARQTVRREGSRFRIHYYPTRGNAPHTIPASADWVGSGQASDPGVPDFVEDLDAALNEAYDALLAMRRTGAPLFTAPGLPIDVTVTDTGEAAGDSTLGWSLRMSARRQESWADMRATAAHELVHVLQGQYYLAMGALNFGANAWFVEAVANHLAARAVGMTDAQRRAFYGEFFDDYLGVSLTRHVDGSMYAAAHLLDYLVARTDDRLIGDILAGPRGNDITAIGEALRARGLTGGLGGALAEYVADLVRTPQGTAGFNLAIKQNLEGWSVRAGRLTGPAGAAEPLSAAAFGRNVAFVRLRGELAPLSVFYGGFTSNLSNDGLLVVDSRATRGALLHSVAYDTVGVTDAAYAGRQPVDAYDQVPASKPWLFRHYGQGQTIRGAEWAVTNTSPASAATLDITAYVLPSVARVDEAAGSVTWDASGIATIPPELIRGWRVYDGQQELTTEPLKTAPGAAEGTFAHPAITPGSWINVAIEDVHGNLWPEYNQFLEVTPKTSDGLKPGQSITYTARVAGRARQEVTWKFSPNDPAKPGSVRINGSTLTFTAPELSPGECGYANFTATSVETPALAASASASYCHEVQFGCVPGDTAVTLAEGGTRPIARMKVGDRVLALGPDGHSLVPAFVQKVLTHADQAYQVHKLETRDGHALWITGNHPVLVKGRGWRPVAELVPGDVLFVHDQATGRLVESPLLALVREVGSAGTVYNLKTSRESYLAGGVMVHNKCLAAGSPIDTPDGPRAVEAIAVGDLVWGERDGQRVATRVTHVYRKAVAAAALPGRLVAPGVRVTDNHPIAVAGRLVPAGSAGLPAIAISGPVYDLRTEAGTYYAGGRLMATGD